MADSTFEHYVCWSPSDVADVMDTEALRVSDGVFAATHHPAQLVRRGLSESEASTAYSQEAFLDEFLDPVRHERDYRFVPVLGDSGTGKSHLIRWLKTQIKETPTRRVILVPKSGTTLRDIIEMILEGHEGGVFDEYRTKLGNAVTAVEDVEGRQALLDALANAVQFRRQPAADQSDEALIREEVAKHLPDFLRDTELRREHWLKEEGVIDRLYASALGREGARPDGERAFTREDLPRDLRADVSKVHSSVQEFYRELQINEEFQDPTVDLLNEALDDAVRYLLRLSGEDLERLLRDVRRALAKQGVELVLLFEDFAKLQGIDRNLLEGVLERSPDGSLAPVFTALACTTGYYRRFADTVRTRVTFRVDLDVPEASVDLQEFASRYLNAARVRAEGMNTWYEEDQDNPYPIKCGECRFRIPCHAAFGAVEGRGLYPFNRIAIEEAYRRTGETLFKPRTLIKGVIRYVLEQHAGDIESGSFPPKSLREHLNEHGRTLDVLSLQKSRSQQPDTHERRRTLVEIWSQSGDIVNLDPGIHQAFLLPELSGVVEAPTPSAGHDDKPSTPTPPRPPKPVSESANAASIKAVSEWGNGSSRMDQKMVQRLRELLHPAVAAHADWNAAGLQRSKIVGSGKLFQNQSVNFRNQTQNVRGGLANLQIPVENQTIEEAALAITGLLKAQDHGSWSFDKGGDYYRRSARALDLWADALLATVRRASTKIEWDPAIAAVELLALGARLRGRPVRSATSPIDRLDAAFVPPNPASEDSGRTDKWRALMDRFDTSFENLTDVVYAHGIAVKGDYSTTLYLDAGRFLPRISRLAKRAWLPEEVVPPREALPRKLYRPLSDLRDNLDERIREAVAAEATRYAAWIDRFERDVDPHWSDKGGEALRNRLSETLTATRDAAQKAGGWPLNPSESAALTRAVNGLREVRLRPALDVAARVRDALDDDTSSDGALLGELGADLDGALEAVTSLLDLADHALTRTEMRLQVVRDDLKGGREASGIRTNIADSLDDVERSFRALAASEPVQP